ncbi:hypothetical protein RINTHM_9560 [Richelia intracellularis HM01]|nr:hypothetical protein RINTHM_9560 [Richelia intracellularis HM01]
MTEQIGIAATFILFLLIFTGVGIYSSKKKKLLPLIIYLLVVM